MWIGRQPRADAPQWRGRRVLAVVDAALWPLACALVVARHGFGGGVVAAMVVAVCLCLAVVRVRRAIFRNHRYRFATWWLLRVALWVLLLALIVRCGVVASALRR